MSVIRESFWVSEFWVYFSEISLILVSQSHVEDSVDIFSALAKLNLLCSPPSMPRDSPQLSSVAQSCPTLCNPMDYNPPGSSVHEDSPGKNTGVSCHALCQEIFPTQGLNPNLLHCRWILYHLSHQGTWYAEGVIIYLRINGYWCLASQVARW